MSFVPPYMGNVAQLITKGVNFVGQAVPAKDLDLQHQQQIENYV
jgi:hypothetical protein